MSLDDFLSLLDGVRRSGDGFMARCPAHPDQVPSLSVKAGDDGRILVNCHAGCPVEAVVEARGLTMADLFLSNNGDGPSVEVARYIYRDESGHELYYKARFTPKRFVRVPAGVPSSLYGLERLQYLDGSVLLVSESEKDADYVMQLDAELVAVAGGGATTWREEWSDRIGKARPRVVVLLEHADDVGRAFSVRVAESLSKRGLPVKALSFPGPEGYDVADAIRDGLTLDHLLVRIEKEPEWIPTLETGVSQSSNPWGRAISAAEFVAQEETEADWLEENVLAPGSVTEIFSPRGLGKTLYALWLAIKLARAGKRVLYIDRDNPRRTIRERLREFGISAASTDSLKLIGRDEAPPLTDRRAWEEFPIEEFDAVFLDSLDSSTEGVGEQDSGKPSRAIAHVLDIAHSKNGPAILILANTTKAGHHGRGSGVIEDRADIVFEVRDATDLKPSGSTPWFQELPPAGREDWAARAGRRKRREKLRLAFVASKFRIGEEPEPFAVEVDTSSAPWTVRDVTAELVHGGEEAALAATREKEERLERAAVGLVAAIREANAKPFNKDKAVAVLQGFKLIRQEARDLIKQRAGDLWLLRKGRGQGAPMELYLKPSAAEMGVSENPLPVRAEEVSISADRMDTERRRSIPREPASIEAVPALAFSPPDPSHSPTISSVNTYARKSYATPALRTIPGPATVLRKFGGRLPRVPLVIALRREAGLSRAMAEAVLDMSVERGLINVNEGGYYTAME